MSRAESNFQHAIVIPSLVVMMVGSLQMIMLPDAMRIFQKVGGSVIFVDTRGMIISNIICFVSGVVVTDNKVISGVCSEGYRH